MKHFTAILSLSICAIILAGCSPEAKGPSAANLFPSHLAGTWQAENQPWKIVLTEDGKVETVLIPFGGVEVKPNRTTKVKMNDGSTSVYTAGDIVMGYDPEQRMLTLSVEMKNIEIKFRDQIIEGHSLDIFEGFVSEDGRQWKPNWVSMFDYGNRFPQLEADVQEVPLVFNKVKITADE